MTTNNTPAKTAQTGVHIPRKFASITSEIKKLADNILDRASKLEGMKGQLTAAKSELLELAKKREPQISALAYEGAAARMPFDEVVRGITPLLATFQGRAGDTLKSQLGAVYTEALKKPAILAPVKDKDGALRYKSIQTQYKAIKRASGELAAMEAAAKAETFVSATANAVGHLVAVFKFAAKYGVTLGDLNQMAFNARLELDDKEQARLPLLKLEQATSKPRAKK